MAFLDTGTIMSPWYNLELSSGYISVKKSVFNIIKYSGKCSNNEQSCRIIKQLQVRYFFFLNNTDSLNGQNVEIHNGDPLFQSKYFCKYKFKNPITEYIRLSIEQLRTYTYILYCIL